LNNACKPEFDAEWERHISYNSDLNRRLSGCKIPNIACTDSSETIIHLSELPVNGPILIFRYSVRHCNICYDRQLKILRNNVEKLPVYVLASYQSNSDFQLYMKLNHEILPIYKIEEKGLNNFIEESDSPYYFILHPDMTATDFYVPDTFVHEAVIAYFRKAAKILNENGIK
jgi:hypothetical protein